MGKNNKQKIMFLSIRDTMFIGESDMISGTWFHNLKKKGVGEMDEIGWQSCQSRVMEMINSILFLLVFEMLFFLKKGFKIWGKYLAPFPHPPHPPLHRVFVETSRSALCYKGLCKVLPPPQGAGGNYGFSFSSVQ